MKKLVNYFLKGLLVFLPAAVTLFMLYWVFSKMAVIGDKIFNVKSPVFGAAATFLAIAAIGFAASNYLFGWFFRLVDRGFAKLPLVKLVYNSVKDLVGAFAGDKKKFDRPVIVSLGQGDIKAVGFITRDSLENIGLSGHVAVYMPQSYNFAGNMVLVSKDAVRPLDMDAAEVMAFVVSGGISGK